MKKAIILFAYWWCIMYPSLAFDTPVMNKHFEEQEYEFKFKIVEYFKERTNL